MYKVKEFKIIVYCVNALKNIIDKVSICNSEIIIYTKSIYIREVLEFFKFNSNLQFKSLIDLSVVDYPSKLKRFEVIYNLLSIYYNIRIRVKTSTDAYSPIPSMTKLYCSANWLEREAWDLYGILFVGHSDLRRILTDYGFEGYPLRKDFPLTGYIELRYDESRKQIVYESIELAQEYRFFDSLNPWQILKNK